MRRRAWLAWLMVSAAAFGCDDDPGDDGACTPETTQSCECPDGRAGTQSCVAAGTGFGACICTSDGGALDSSTSDDARTADASPDGSVDGSALDHGAGSDGSPDLPDATADATAGDMTWPECTLTTASAGDCKNCCDCLPGLMCDSAATCRETCDALPDAHFAAQADRPPFVAPSALGPDGDYGACLAAATSEACKACCCDDALLCGDARHCRTACNEHDFGEPDPEPDPGRCALITASVTAAGFGDRVEVDCDDTHAWIRTDALPSHDLMNGITTTNDQVPVPATWAAPVRLAPALAAGLTTIDSALGVAVNGVAIFDYSSQGEIDPAVYNPAVDTTLDGQLDVCNGHAGRGDDYHYHAAPVCMIEAMQNAGPDAILGWGFDGFPLFGFTRPDGAALAAGDLDLCNGMADDTHGYRYHLSAAPPYVWQCLRGEVDLAIVPRIPPMASRAGGQPRPQGRPPRGGVDDLRFVRDAEGGAEMTYRYEGADHFIRYRPSAQAGCYVFDIDTVSNGVVQGEYCRDAP